MNRALVFACVLSRLFLGAVMLKDGVGKVRGGFIGQQVLQKHVDNALAQGSPPAFYRSFLKNHILPRARLVSYLVVSGELAVGVFLVLGFLTRWAAIVGILMMLNFALASGIRLGPSLPIAFALLFFVVAASNAGRVVGIDGALRGRAPRWLV